MAVARGRMRLDGTRCQGDQTSFSCHYVVIYIIILYYYILQHILKSELKHVCELFLQNIFRQCFIS